MEEDQFTITAGEEWDRWSEHFCKWVNSMVHLEFKLIRKGNVNIREKSQQIRNLYVGDFRLFEGNEISEVLKFFRLVKKKDRF